MMRTSLKIIIFTCTIVILGALVFLGYNYYRSQQAPRQPRPYTTRITPSPTLPTGVFTESDKTGAIEQDLNMTNLSDLESELKGLGQEATGL